MSKPAEPKIALRREDWDFSSISDSHLYSCLRYELAREVINPNEFFSHVTDPRSLNLEPVLDGMQPEDVKALSPVLREVIASTYRISAKSNPDDTESLREREMITGLYFLHKDGVYRAYPPDLASSPWLLLSKEWQHVISSLSQFYESSVFVFPIELTVESIREGKPISTSRESLKHYSVFLNWESSNLSLTESFARWIEQNRPIEYPNPSSGGSLSTSDSLNAIGAMRLRHHFTAGEAMAITEKALGSPLYSAPFSWDRAATRALRLFREEFTNAQGPRSMKRKANLRGRPPLKRSVTEAEMDRFAAEMRKTGPMK